MGLFNFDTRLAKAQASTFVLVLVGNFLGFIAVLTPAWQTADDLDAGTRVDSGLWLYCPGAAQCWYIFSDNLINYYEKVDVCRFLLIGDCRKKLLRTPYFFGWHYAVLILMICALCMTSLSLGALLYSYLRPAKRRIATIVLDVCLFFGFLLFCIALSVFMINAEMLESRYLIGIKNTFEKSYGYSFYIACLGLTVLMFAAFAAVLITTYVFFMSESMETFEPSFKYSNNYPQTGFGASNYRVMQPVNNNPNTFAPGPGYAPSDVGSIPTRTFLSY
ncbi:hypothetical protein FO519_008330 [Halicephalobus sp. NKZ332]|nr:hypothetical protein FO519_008330 [Halicephalobus sp. NKZ332]